ncbi:hypothetical protein ABGB12_26270 [Actinocorallia sp. B10E7]|uniref:hypothetical protein n=1 Tax=Actinocorallia sp. B10E7 TaxID=3153558 RepID=UPI00325DE458
MRVPSSLALLLLLAGCGSSEETVVSAPPASNPVVAEEPSPTAQPQTAAAAEEAAAETFDSYSAGEYGDSWDTWTKKAKEVVPRDYYVGLHAACVPIAEGVPFEIKSVKLAEDKATAKVRASRTLPVLNITHLDSYTFVYEDGAWKWMPEDDFFADYRKGLTLEQLAARRKKEGSCS